MDTTTKRKGRSTSWGRCTNCRAVIGDRVPTPQGRCPLCAKGKGGPAMTAWATYGIERSWAADLNDRYTDLLTQRRVRNLLGRLDRAHDTRHTPVHFDRRTPDSGVARRSGRYEQRGDWERSGLYDVWVDRGIYLSARGTSTWVVCHEWAHMHSHHSHGPAWLARYCDAVETAISVKAAKQLRLMLGDHTEQTARMVRARRR